MKMLKIIGIILGVILFAVVVLVLTLKGERHMERSITINAPVEKVFMVANDFSYAKDWSPWFQVDPDTKYVFSKNTSGLGAKYSWESENPDVGIGSQEIIEVSENERVNTLMVFDGMTGIYHAAFILKKIDDNTTEVTWTYDGKADPVFEKLFIDYGTEPVLGPVYEQGLQSLKAFIEAMPDPQPELLMEGILEESTAESP